MKQKRKLLSMVLTVALVLGCVTIPTSGVFAAQNVNFDTTMKAQAVKSGELYNGKNTFKWTLDTGSGELKITGKGALSLHSSDDLFVKYGKQIKKIVIAKGATSLDCYFFGSFGLDGAAGDMSNLKEISLPSTLTKMTGRMMGCGLTSIYIPDSVKSLASQLFYDCKDLERVTGGKGLTSVEKQTFYGTKWFDTPGFHILGKYCLYYNGKGLNENTVTIPTGVEVIVDGAFGNIYNKMSTIIIPASVKKIESYAFSGCDELTNIQGGTNVTEVGYRAFARTKWIEQAGDIVDLGKTLVRYNGTAANYTVPKKYEAIAGGAFSENKTLKSIKFEHNLKSIPSYAFEKCENLTSITVPSSVTTIAYGAFDHCTSLPKVKMPTSLKSIGTGAFIFCSSLSDVQISGGANNTKLQSIGFKAFGGCKNLKSLTIPKQVKTIEKYAYGFDISAGDYQLTPVKMSNATIVGVKGTKAQSYAKANIIKFKSVKNTSPNASTSTTKLKAPVLTASTRKVDGNSLQVLKFTKVTGATGYQIYFSFSGQANSWEKLKTLKANQQEFSFYWQEPKKCYYKVRAYKKVGTKYTYSPFSAVKSLK